eukprot:2676986-Amphidinium_carterae.1
MNGRSLANETCCALSGVFLLTVACCYHACSRNAGHGDLLDTGGDSLLEQDRSSMFFRRIKAHKGIVHQGFFHKTGNSNYSTIA